MGVRGEEIISKFLQSMRREMLKNFWRIFGEILRWSVFGHFLGRPHPILNFFGSRRWRDNFKIPSEYERGVGGELLVNFWRNCEVVSFLVKTERPHPPLGISGGQGG